MKPYASSCDDNSEPIFTVIQPYLKQKNSVLEIASDTGQHAVYFSQRMPHITWQPSDLPNMLNGIQQWINDSNVNNICQPIELDVCSKWPNKHYDVVFSANALHIMSWRHVQCFIKNLPYVMKDQGLCIIYGPFNYAGQYTSESNARFDLWLKQRDPLSGIRDFEALNDLAQQQNLSLIQDYEMPANNRILVFQKN